ncbi:MAG: flagellar basal body rod protein FlgC [Desulfobacterium sp.]|nr:flagellar basal body rod protein FlgC [Desulfobacterium sp.]MBU3950071.1 flagellar basal body rod protein FlgC [Pseudomonadota bacterium]MBU4010686.1 flagellar basal body rod protein FlgC [Pseudomonadota bacterium]MBU4037766.1 flagellar basal body rod protein FlgC [Pseudomonadota bacterium]
MNFVQSLGISSSGLYAQRKRMDVIAENLSNIETTRTEKGGPYRRKMIAMGAEPIDDFDEVLGSQLEGVRVDAIVEDKSPFKIVFNPSHPDADKEGYLRKPNVDLSVEMANMLMARNAFSANLSAIKSTRQMVLKALEIGK